MGFQSNRGRVIPPDGSADPGAGGSSAFDPALVRAQLERILESDEFQGSDRTRRFLRYVVEETLAGRADRIKAFSVAVAAFDRDETFNPQADPIVRIEAGRLRRCLERYYLVAGGADGVRIEIPKGCYVPTFSEADDEHGRDPQGAPDEAMPTPVEAHAEPDRGGLPDGGPFRLPTTFLLSILIFLLAATLGFLVWDYATVHGTTRASPLAEARPLPPQPSVAVLPFGIVGTSQTDANLQTGMTNEIVRELSQYPGMLVLGPSSLHRFGPTPDATTVGQGSGASFVLSGNVQHVQDRVRVAVQLSETELGSVIWAETFDRNFNVQVMFDLQAEIGREIVRKIAQPQGAIALHDWKRTKGMAPETWEAYDCVVLADELHRRGEPPSGAADVRDCLQRAVEKEPRYADPWIMLAVLEIDELRFTPQARIASEKLDAAYAAASRGLDLAPESGRAHLALMMALSFRGETERALAAGNIALRLSPQDPDVLAEVGQRQIISGSPDLGLNLIRQAADLYQEPRLGHRLALALGYLRKGLAESASDLILEMPPSRNFVYWSVAAAVHGKAGRQASAQQAVKELLTLYPDFASWALEEVEQRHLAPDLATQLIEGWQKAGLLIELPPEKGIRP